MRTYNVTARRLRALADAIEDGTADPEDARLKLTGEAEMTVCRERLEEGCGR